MDLAPAMLGYINDFSDFVEKNNPNIEVTHCMIYRHAPTVKYLKPTLKAVKHGVIKVVIFIKGPAAIS